MDDSAPDPPGSGSNAALGAAAGADAAGAEPRDSISGFGPEGAEAAAEIVPRARPGGPAARKSASPSALEGLGDDLQRTTTTVVLISAASGSRSATSAIGVGGRRPAGPAGRREAATSTASKTQRPTARENAPEPSPGRTARGLAPNQTTRAAGFSPLTSKGSQAAGRPGACPDTGTPGAPGRAGGGKTRWRAPSPTAAVAAAVDEVAASEAALRAQAQRTLEEQPAIWASERALEQGEAALRDLIERLAREMPRSGAAKKTSEARAVSERALAAQARARARVSREALAGLGDRKRELEAKLRELGGDRDVLLRALQRLLGEPRGGGVVGGGVHSIGGMDDEEALHALERFGGGGGGVGGGGADADGASSVPLSDAGGRGGGFIHSSQRARHHHHRRHRIEGRRVEEVGSEPDRPSASDHAAHPSTTHLPPPSRELAQLLARHERARELAPRLHSMTAAFLRRAARASRAASAAERAQREHADALAGLWAQADEESARRARAAARLRPKTGRGARARRQAKVKPAETSARAAAAATLAGGSSAPVVGQGAPPRPARPQGAPRETKAMAGGTASAVKISAASSDAGGDSASGIATAVEPTFPPEVAEAVTEALHALWPRVCAASSLVRDSKATDPVACARAAGQIAAAAASAVELLGPGRAAPLGGLSALGARAWLVRGSTG